MDFISDDFPFTPPELRNALALAYPAGEAARLSAHIIALGQERNAESPSPGPLPRYASAHPATGQAGILIPPSIWALLAVSSTSLAQRCEEWRLRTRLASRAAREGALRQEIGLTIDGPIPAELISSLDAEDALARRSGRGCSNRRGRSWRNGSSLFAVELSQPAPLRWKPPLGLFPG